MAYSSYKRQRIINYRYVRGFKSSAIKKLLHREGIAVSARGIRRFLAAYNRTGMMSELHKDELAIATGRLGGRAMGLKSVLTSTLSLVGPTSIVIIVPTIQSCCYSIIQ